MIPKEARELWCNALESGEYQQGHGRLYYDGRYCCLGVACDLAIKAGVIEFFDDTDPDLLSYPEVMSWLGLRTEIGAYACNLSNCTIAANLVAENDCGRTFESIAAIIRSEPEGLVVT